jgi:predicted Fe-S protein YdhL (DUF1289 family)
MEVCVSLHSDHADFVDHGGSIISPCKNQCRLNAQEFCEGCGRSLREIEQWWHYSDAQRRAIMSDLAQRPQHFSVAQPPQS